MGAALIEAESTDRIRVAVVKNMIKE